ncbi:aspartate/glutamate racemase family protein [Nocardia africana]|uniref:Hydantoin racemase n=1 Tax=Nocardia africana TaxID=134964 RepID=A0A378WYK2_9NOCA|nr:aspartate/glutamate racemase family protein [Nocardia africana]MCC3312415.1 aspartate/glutamate racemase family protein [Nocardia africana]SUA46269.1 Hydantoin racemase [Nocardia africana]
MSPERKILNIVPVPVPPEALAAFAAQIPDDIVHPGFENVFVSARAGGTTLDSAYETTLADAFVLEAGSRAEEQGYAAVCVNSMSDSALAALRSRLTIPVVAPSQASMLLASLLGKKFSVITMWPQWHELYHKAAREQGLSARMASVRDIGVAPDTAELLAGKEDFVFAALEREARTAIDDDGADVIVLGSTTMHQSHAYLSRVLEVPVLNPGVVAYKLCELLVVTGLSHSKRAFPSPALVQDDLLSALAATH